MQLQKSFTTSQTELRIGHSPLENLHDTALKPGNFDVVLHSYSASTSDEPTLHKQEIGATKK